MTGWKRFDPYAATRDEIEEGVATPAKAAKAAKVSIGSAAHPAEEASRVPSPGAGDQPTTTDSWSAEDWQAFFDERAAIAEREGGLPLEKAEEEAFASCVTEWLDRNPTRSSSDRCCWCGAVERQDDPLLPFGLESTGNAWLHRACWEPWRDWREREAITALAGLLSQIWRPGKDCSDSLSAIEFKL
jgi:hypothetical protein